MICPIFQKMLVYVQSRYLGFLYDTAKYQVSKVLHYFYIIIINGILWTDVIFELIKISPNWIAIILFKIEN